jgi:peroxiredoxin
MSDLLAVIGIVARLALAAVFIVAAAAKLRDRAGARQAVADFGLPVALVGPVAQSLPYSEIILALGLIPAATACWAALGVFLMLAGFTTGMVVNLRRGRKPACHCFGEMDSAPIGWHSLIRNAILGLVALVIIVLGSGAGSAELGDAPAIAGRVTGLTAMGVDLAALGLLALLAEGFIVLRMRAQNAALILRLETLEEKVRMGARASEPAILPAAGLPIGATAPSFRLNDLTGQSVTLEALRAAGNPVMLLFTDPNCGPCLRLLPDVGLWQSEYGDEMTIALLSRGTVDENLAKTSEYGIRNVVLQNDREVREAYRVAGTPSAVIIRYDGTIGSETAAGAEAITILATQALTQAIHVSPAPAPAAPARLPAGA